MANLIQMDTERVRSFIAHANLQLDEMESAVSNLENRVKSIPWEGHARDEYVAEFSSLSGNFYRLTDLGRQTILRVQREMEEWLSVDQQGATNITSIGTTLGGIIAGIRKTFADLIRDWNAIQAKTRFEKWWKDQSTEEKEAFLREQYGKITKKLGLDPIEMKVIQIEDLQGGDSRGYYNGKGIYIDIDNLESDKPWDLINTLAHETRHQYQFHVVENYLETGQLPDDVSVETVNSWQENIDNYVSADDDFEGYYGQPIETDARDFGGKYSNNVVDSDDWAVSTQGSW